MSTNVKKHSHPTLAQTCMASLSSVYETSMVMTRLSTVSAKRHYLEILGKVCGDKWQSIWTYLAKYLDILLYLASITTKQPNNQTTQSNQTTKRLNQTKRQEDVPIALRRILLSWGMEWCVLSDYFLSVDDVQTVG